MTVRHASLLEQHLSSFSAQRCAYATIQVIQLCNASWCTCCRYGTVPVVRRTGGLADTVFDVDDDRERGVAAGIDPNGFAFEGADAAGVDYALNRFARFAEKGFHLQKLKELAVGVDVCD